MFVLIVDVHVKPDQRDAYVVAIRENAAAANQEPGCARFEVVQDHADPDHFVLYEVYDDEAAFQAHRETEHFKRYISVSTGFNASEPVRHTGGYVYSPDA